MKPFSSLFPLLGGLDTPVHAGQRLLTIEQEADEMMDGAEITEPLPASPQYRRPPKFSPTRVRLQFPVPCSAPVLHPRSPPGTPEQPTQGPPGSALIARRRHLAALSLLLSRSSSLSPIAHTKPPAWPIPSPVSKPVPFRPCAHPYALVFSGRRRTLSRTLRHPDIPHRRS